MDPAPLSPTHFQQLPTPLCHPKVQIRWDIPWWVGFKPRKDHATIKSQAFIQFLQAQRLLFLQRAWGGWPEPAVASAPCLWRSNVQLVLKMHLGKQCGGVKAVLTGDLSLSFLAASLHREGLNNSPPEHGRAVGSPQPIPLPSGHVLVLSLGLGPSYRPCGFSARQAVCPEVPQPSSPAPGRIRLP